MNYQLLTKSNPSTISRICMTERKRKRLVSLQSAVNLTSSILQKLREMKINDDCCSLPMKKRKLRGNAVENIDKEESLVADPSENRNQAVSLAKTSPYSKGKRVAFHRRPWKMTAIWGKCLISKGFNSKISTLNRLLSLFENCVNFIQPRGFPKIEDIDRVARQFGEFGKVLCIQDHWVQPRDGALHPSVWSGASVTYSCQDECQRALKALSLAQSSMICISLADYLIRIDHIESIWKSLMAEYAEDFGTCVIIEGIPSRTSIAKMRKEFSSYGPILHTKWEKQKERQQKSCEVTYRSSVVAIAAAWGLDGKCVQKCRLKTMIKISGKEQFIHRKSCETF